MLLSRQNRLANTWSATYNLKVNVSEHGGFVLNDAVCIVIGVGGPTANSLLITMNLTHGCFLCLSQVLGKLHGLLGASTTKVGNFVRFMRVLPHEETDLASSDQSIRLLLQQAIDKYSFETHERIVSVDIGIHQ